MFYGTGIMDWVDMWSECPNNWPFSAVQVYKVEEDRDG